MNFNIVDRTILKVRHGSHCYGTNIEGSDLDIKGVCIPPVNYYFGFNNFEQHQQAVSAGADVDLVIYSLKKFAKLATECNPNIIEILFVDQADVLHSDKFGDELRKHRNLFISKRARWTFSGYAHAQVKRINSHRRWLLDPPKVEPKRETFGLSNTMKVSQSELGAFQSLTEHQDVELPKDIVTLFVKERAYQAAKAHWDQYQTWKKERNVKRAVLEAKFGYDTKHGAHLIRLMRMCREIMKDGNVLVKRPDRDELLAIRAGAWTYERLLEEAESIEKECKELYETSSLPREPNRSKIDELIVNLTADYLKGNP